MPGKLSGEMHRCLPEGRGTLAGGDTRCAAALVEAPWRDGGTADKAGEMPTPRPPQQTFGSTW